MGGRGHVAEDAAEAVVEGGWADDDVGGGEAHAQADEVAVVEDGGVAKAGGFGEGSGAGCELDVDCVVPMEWRVWGHRLRSLRI